MNKENNIVLGIIFMTLAMFCLSVNDVLVKGLSTAYPIWEVIFFRAFSGVVVSIILILKPVAPFPHYSAQKFDV